jgi:hypothetical protein
MSIVQSTYQSQDTQIKIRFWSLSCFYCSMLSSSTIWRNLTLKKEQKDFVFLYVVTCPVVDFMSDPRQYYRR